MMLLFIGIIIVLAIALAYFLVKRKKNDCIVQIAVEEKELDSQIFYMIVGIHKSGKKVYLNKKPYTLYELEGDEVVNLINEEINKCK